MANQQDYFTANRLNWDERARIHAASRSYDLDAYIRDPARISDVVSFDREALGDLKGMDALHLQCHIGTDTLSLARLGANSITGLDQSEESLAVARDLFARTNTSGRFVQANAYDAAAALHEQYDLVFTGVGALNWLPDIKRWAATVAKLLRPGGRLYLREGHPMLWAMADTTDGTLRVEYPYFETLEPMAFDEVETYTDQDAPLVSTRTYEWNHGLGEIVTAVIDAGLVLTSLTEHDGLEWQMFPNMVLEGKQYKLPIEQRDLCPMMYTLEAKKP